MNNENRSPLQLLCERDGSLEAVKYLCGEPLLVGESNDLPVETKDRANINYQDISGGTKGFTPIYSAAIGGLSRGVENLLNVYNYLRNKGADTSIVQTCNGSIPKTVKEYVDGKVKLLGGTNASEAAKIEHEEFENLYNFIENGKEFDIEIIKKNIDLLSFIKDDNTLLDIAVSRGNENAITQLLELDPVVEKYIKEVSHGRKDFSAGAVSLAASGVVSSLIVDIRKNSGEVVVATAAALAIGAIAGATTWGIGRLGYECYHQYQNPDDANIGRNFTTSMNTLKELESSSNMNKDSLEYLSALEESIIIETKKASPNVKVMGEVLIKSDLLRKSLFKGVDEALKDGIVEQSRALIESFEKWKKIQQGRETSKGLKMFFDFIPVAVIAGLGGAISAAVTKNSMVAIGGGLVAGGAVMANNKWVDRAKVKSSTNIKTQ